MGSKIEFGSGIKETLLFNPPIWIIIIAFSLKNTFNFSKLKVGSLLVFFGKKMNGDPAIIHNLPSMKCKI